MFEVVILAGGKGARLKSVTGELPKPMVDVEGVPFLYRLMQYICSFGCSKIILSLGYQSDYIIDRVTSDNPVDCDVKFSVETSPLGTGGAIKHAARFVSTERFVVVNGDTFSKIDYADFYEKSKGGVTIACVKVEDVSRYGTIDVGEDGKIKGFNEKGRSGEGIINSGSYVLTRDGVSNYEGDSFSIEEKFMSGEEVGMSGYLSDGYFIDIGIPKDYQKACDYFK